MMIRYMVASSLVLALFAPAAGAGWLGDVLLSTAGGLGDRAVRESSEKVYERAKESLTRRDEPGREGDRRPGAAPETTAAGADRIDRRRFRKHAARFRAR
jgi:hypothetical protein